MALEDDHGGPRPEPEVEGRIAYYRGEYTNPYPASHVRHDGWWRGYRNASQREENREGG